MPVLRGASCCEYTVCDTALNSIALDWFREATETLERYQQEQVKQESDSWNKERRKYLVELEEELRELNAKARISDLDLLKWVYSS